MADKKKDESTLKLGENAVSRFTRTPVHITDEGHIRQSMHNLIEGLGGAGFRVEGEDPTKDKRIYRGPATGLYADWESEGKSDPSINVTSHADKASFPDVMGAIAHEDIHALLEQAKYKYPYLDVDPTSWLKSLLYDPTELARQGMQKASRGGDWHAEVPAYVGAYKPEELPGFSEKDRQDYLKRLMPTLNPRTAETLKRMLTTYDLGRKSNIMP